MKKNYYIGSPGHLVGSFMSVLLTCLTTILLIKAFNFGEMIKKSPIMESIAYILILTLAVGISSFIIRIVIFRSGFEKKVNEFFEEKRQKKLVKLKEKYSATQKKIKNLKETAKRAYEIRTVESIDQFCCFRVILRDSIITNLPPYLMVNGQKVGITFHDDHSVICHGKDMINPKDEEIIFSIGESYMIIKNPYFFNSNAKAEIFWQIEGHGPERKVYLPKEYFPNASQSAIFKFELKIHKKSFGACFGRLNEEDKIPIYLGKMVCKKDYAPNKVAKLLFGEIEILLPPPSLLIRNGDVLKKI